MTRVEVLDRVGGLLLLPNTELAKTKQVAEFYGVESNSLRQTINRNREELEANGMKVYSYAEIKTEVLDVTKSNVLNELGISKRDTNIFNKRAILLVGFMLRDSQVAQQVRNQALNIIESASDEHKTFEITKSKRLGGLGLSGTSEQYKKAHRAV